MLQPLAVRRKPERSSPADAAAKSTRHVAVLRRWPRGYCQAVSEESHLDQAQGSREKSRNVNLKIPPYHISNRREISRKSRKDAKERQYNSQQARKGHKDEGGRRFGKLSGLRSAPSRLSMLASEGSAFGPIPAKVHRTPPTLTRTRLVHEQPSAGRVGTEFNPAWISLRQQSDRIPGNSCKHWR